MLKSSLSLAVIAGTCASLLALTQLLTDERIDHNIHAHEMQLITELAGTIPPASSTWSADVWNLCNDTLLARAEVTGYGGPVALVIALAGGSQDLRLRGLRVIRHQETPGLADFIEQPEQGWLLGLRGRNRPQIGAIDTVAGATITSRAVQRAVLRAFSRAQDHTRPSAECKP
jgi:electron transport complex protein RnfG